MKKFLIVSVLISLVIAIIIVGFGFLEYFSNPQGNELYKTYFLLLVCSLFLVLFFNLSFKTYFYLFLACLFIGLGAWVYNFIIAYFLNYLPRLSNFQWGLAISFSMCCVAPFISVLSCNYIQKYEHKYNKNVISGKYHMHEGFMGLVLIGVGVGLFILRTLLLPFELIIPGLHIIGTLIFSFITLFPFFGGFLIGRDWYDFKSFQFFTPVSENKEKRDSEPYDEEFYSEKPINTRLLGVILSSFGILFVVFSTDFLPYSIFLIKPETLRVIGWLIFTIGAIIIGYDWIRLLKKYFPEEYKKLNQV